MLETLFKVLAGIAIAAGSSWITVQLSRHKFRTEKWWEKKVEAYERVIEAFHNSKRFAYEHMKAEYGERKVEETRDKELRRSAQLARDEILRASDIGAFILSKNALSILAKYEAESESPPEYDSWYEYLDADWRITHRYMKDFIAEAHRDLKQ